MSKNLKLPGGPECGIYRAMTFVSRTLFILTLVLALPAQAEVWRAGAQLTPVGLVAPFKWGVFASRSSNENSLVELSYNRGKLGIPAWIADVGGISEERTALTWRYFGRWPHFHWVIGASHLRSKVFLGDDTIHAISAGYYPAAVDVMVVENLSLDLGLAHKWKLGESWHVGVDWFVLHQPIVILKSETPALDAAAANDSGVRNSLDDVLSFMERVPTFSALRVTVSLAF